MKPLFLILLLSAFTATAKTYSVESPDGRLKVDVGAGERLTYSISLDEEKLVHESEIAMILEDGTMYGGDARVKKVSRRSVDEDLFSSFYKKSRIENDFNEMTLKFSDFWRRPLYEKTLVPLFDDGSVAGVRSCRCLRSPRLGGK